MWVGVRYEQCGSIRASGRLAEVVEELIKLGYLKGRKRRDVRAIEEALVKLHVSHSCKLRDGWRIAILDSLVAAKVLLGLFGLWPVRTLGRLG